MCFGEIDTTLRGRDSRFDTTGVAGIQTEFDSEGEHSSLTIGGSKGCVEVCFSCNDLPSMRERGVLINGTAISGTDGDEELPEDDLFSSLEIDAGKTRVFQLRCDPQAGVFEVFVEGDRKFSMSLPKGPLVFAATLCGHSRCHGEGANSVSNAWEVTRCAYGHPKPPQTD